MSKLGRRESIKLAGAAVVVGPSVLFSRTASAGPQRTVTGLEAGAFKVEVKGMYDKVPGVAAVDLGTATLGARKSKSELHFVTISMKTGAASAEQKLTKAFAKPARKGSRVAHKISVSLYGKGGRSPAITYHVLNAVPVSITQGEGAQHFKWNAGQIEVVSHKIGSASGRFKPLPSNSFKVEIEGVSVLATQSMSKFSYDARGRTVSRTDLDPAADGARGWKSSRALSSNELKFHQTGAMDYAKFDPIDLKVRDQLALTSFVTARATPLSGALDGQSVKLEKLSREGSAMRANKATPVLMQFLSGSAANKASPDLMLFCPNGKTKSKTEHELRLKSIEYPKLEAGSRALVTETYHFEFAPDGK